MRRLLLCVLALALTGCVRELEVVASLDEGPLPRDDAGMPPPLPDLGPPDLGPLDSGPLDAGPPDLGPPPPDMGRPTGCDGPVSEPILCLGTQESFAGNEVTIALRLAMPVICEGVGTINASFTLDGERLTYLDSSDEGCLQTAQDGDLIVWTRRARAADESCPAIYAPGVQDLLRLRVDPEAPPGRYDLQFRTVRIGDPGDPAVCQGTLTQDGLLIIDPS